LQFGHCYAVPISYRTIKQLEDALHHATNLAKQLDRLKTKLDKTVQSEGITVNDESHKDFKQV